MEEKPRNKREIEAVDDEYLQWVADACSSEPRMNYKQLSVHVLGKEENYLYSLRSRYPQLKEMMRQTVLNRFQEMAQAAQQVIYDLAVSAESESVRLASARDIMSRGNYDPVAKVENTNKDITVELNLDEDTD